MGNTKRGVIMEENKYESAMLLFLVPEDLVINERSEIKLVWGVSFQSSKLNQEV